MKTLRITTQLVWWGLAVHLALRLGLLFNAGFGQAARHDVPLDVLRVLSALIAYGLAFYLCWRMTDEYRETKWMRLAWLALTCSAGLSLLRPFARPLPFWGNPIDLYNTPSEYTLLMHCILVPANFCLLLGLLAIWWAYHEIGIGVRMQRRDAGAIAILLILLLPFLLSGNLLTEARAYYRATSILQVIGQILMFLIAAASLLLHRAAMQFGSGRLAPVLRWLMLYALWRLGLLLVVSLARFAFPRQNSLITDLAETGWQVAPWLLALAVTYRAELTEHAAQRLTRLRQARAQVAELPALTFTR
jgi:hypothetical protein